MTQLIKITEQNGKRAVSARELHNFLGSKQEFAHWIKNRINEYGFIENQDFEVFDKFIKNSNGGRPLKEFVVSISMAKELAMVEKTEQGRQARQYFIEMEKVAIAKALVTPQFKRTNINSVSAKRVELINTIRNYLRWGDMHKVAKELNLTSAYVKRVMVNKEFNTEQADTVVNALYQKAMQNKNELLFGYQDMIDMLRN
ncbi:antA/AntB antirepressor family protein [Epilithonimonas mollis]|uniref:Phage anti-repressor protein n=1 Tax=Epilithonimonas mollis TaxID=216903 RepID=A0A1M6UQS3_9FLAO|nr:antA/AntB antirepressor family protein [Epilithonimonas mollis]SHK71523.1 Phage anti-repressor protein [Epilithonimonas mollis]